MYLWFEDDAAALEGGANVGAGGHGDEGEDDMIEEGGAVEELWLEASDVDGVGVFETKEGVLNLLDLGGEGAMGQDEVDAIVEGSGV